MNDSFPTTGNAVTWHYDPDANAFRLRVGRFDSTTVTELLAFARTVKQTDATMAVLEFEPRVEETNWTGGLDYEGRFEWSKRGQLLTDLTANCGIPFVAVLDAPVFGEAFELALACPVLLWRDGVDAGLAADGEPYFPRWGALNRIYEILGKTAATMRLINCEHASIAQEIRKRRAKHLRDGEDLEGALGRVAGHLRDVGPVARRLSVLALGGNPTEKPAPHYLESTIFANEICAAKFDDICHLAPTELPTKLMSEDISNHRDDFGIDYDPFDHYPENEINLLNRKSRFEEVQAIIDQDTCPLRGRCIELGSGHGYFSAMLSRKPEVDEVVAFDISASSVLRWGPVIWDRIDPDWSKLRYVIGDMNKIEDDYGTYDTVVFCASLHHSSNASQSLRTAHDLLGFGGVVVLHGEHYDPMFFARKKRNKTRYPHTIREFSQLLQQTGFRPVVFRYALRGKRFPRLKTTLFTVAPFKFVNGWFHFASFIMFGIKRKLDT